MTKTVTMPSNGDHLEKCLANIVEGFTRVKKNAQSLWPSGWFAQHPINRVLVCGRKLPPPLYAHVVNFPRLEVPLSGCYENQVEVNGEFKVSRLKPGSALFAPPNCWNLPTWKRPVRLVSLLFGKKQLGVSIVTAKGGNGKGVAARKFSLPHPLTGPAAHILDAMIELVSAGGPPLAMAELARALLGCVRHQLRQPVTTNKTRSQGLLEDVCVFLQNNYQYNISRDSVAQQFGVSPSHLSRLFQTQGHMTFSGYLAHVRIDRAKHLLATYNFKLDDVAARCGYHETSYFCRVFRLLTKLSPAAYRIHHRRGREAVNTTPDAEQMPSASAV